MSDETEIFFFGFVAGACFGIIICKIVVFFGLGTLKEADDGND